MRKEENGKNTANKINRDIKERNEKNEKNIVIYVNCCNVDVCNDI